jgi:hypothetical protein
MTFAWVDSSRAAFLDPTATARRELMVDVWYPTSGRAHGSAPYLPNLDLLRRVQGDSAARRRFAPAYALIEAGQLATHAVEGASPECPRAGCPVVVFSHGGGVDRSSYTTQYEDLASHGYVVVSVAHTFNTHLVLFPDGRLVRSVPQPLDTEPVDTTLPRWRQELVRESRQDVYLRRVFDVEAADIRFVIGRLVDGAGRVTVDPNRIGAAGHSAGGEAAARACQIDSRIRSCLNQDGAIHGLPFSRDAAGRTLRQPFLYFTRVVPRPSEPDEALKAMQITRVELDSLLEDVWTGPVRLLSDMPGGAYRVSLNTPGMTHMSFSDEPLLQAVGDSIKTADARLILALVTEYTRAFFDRTLLAKRDTRLDQRGARDPVIVERFSPRTSRP